MGAAQAASPRNDIPRNERAGVRVSPATLRRILVQRNESKPTPTSVCPLGLGDLPAYALSTISSMVSCVNKFFAFLTRHRLCETDHQGLNATVPTFDWVTLHHVAFLYQTLSPRGHMRTTCPSVCAHVSAIRTWARSNGRPDPALDPSTRLPHTKHIHSCKGTERRLGGKAMTRTPLSLTSLRRMITNLRLGTIVKGTVIFDMIAALPLAFFGLLSRW